AAGVRDRAHPGRGPDPAQLPARAHERGELEPRDRAPVPRRAAQHARARDAAPLRVPQAQEPAGRDRGLVARRGSDRAALLIAPGAERCPKRPSTRAWTSATFISRWPTSSALWA